MLGVYVSCAVGFVFMLMFLVKYNKKRSVMGVFNKMTVSLFFIMTAFFGLLHVMATTAELSVLKYGLCLIIGLFFGTLGDIYLDQKWVYADDSEKYLYAGFAVFGIGHFFYIGAMIMKAGLTVTHMLIAAGLAVVIAVINLIMEKITALNFGKFRPVVTLYSFVVGLTMTTALASLVVTYLSLGMSAVLPWLIFTVAGALFLVSDIILSSQYFGTKNTPVNFVLNHVTYFVAQYLIALTIIFA